MEDPQKQTGASHIDLDKVLLPKKEGTPSVDSAQRINAGVLFEQERTATLPELEKPAAAPQPQVPKSEQVLVKPLQTYQGDIESLVGEKQVSVVSIAAAEAERRGMQPIEQAAASQGRPWLKKTLIVAVGILLLAAAGGIGFYIYVRSQPVPLSEQVPAPFMFVDETQTTVLQPADARREIMNALVSAKSNVSLSLGLVGRIQIAKPTALNDGTLSEVAAPEFLQALAPNIPTQLVRTLEPQMLLGVHSYDENQAFMLLQADSYETAYSGMLAWEANMRGDLSPLFTRTPAVRTLPPPIVSYVPAPVATTTASSSIVATSTQGVAASSSEPAVPAVFFQGNFIDQIVENRDARVILNQDGDILLLWTFLDRSIIVIATNEATLREIVSRISQASILSLPPSR